MLLTVTPRPPSQVYREGNLISPPARGHSACTTLLSISAEQDLNFLLKGTHLVCCTLLVVLGPLPQVYREGDLISPPARGLQTTLIPAGGAAVVEVDLPVPGNFTLIDHSIFRMDKGAIGFLKVRCRWRILPTLCVLQHVVHRFRT